VLKLLKVSAPTNALNSYYELSFIANRNFESFSDFQKHNLSAFVVRHIFGVFACYNVSLGSNPRVVNDLFLPFVAPRCCSFSLNLVQSELAAHIQEHTRVVWIGTCYMYLALKRSRNIWFTLELRLLCTFPCWSRSGWQTGWINLLCVFSTK